MDSFPTLDVCVLKLFGFTFVLKEKSTKKILFQIQATRTNIP